MTLVELDDLILRYGGDARLRDVVAAEARRLRAGCSCREPGESRWRDGDCPSCREAQAGADDAETALAWGPY